MCEQAARFKLFLGPMPCLSQSQAAIPRASQETDDAGSCGRQDLPRKQRSIRLGSKDGVVVGHQLTLSFGCQKQQSYCSLETKESMPTRESEEEGKLPGQKVYQREISLPFGKKQPISSL